MREVLDAAVPTHPAKCVFIVTKKLVIILIMIQSIILTESKNLAERRVCLYISLISMIPDGREHNNYV